MEWTISLLMSGLGVILQTVIIVWLYNHYIIPKIVSEVQTEIITKMETWVDSVKTDVSDKVCAFVGSKLEESTIKVKRSIAGKRGKTQKMLALAENYLDANLSEDLSDEQEDSVITEAITAYGVDIVNSILEARRKKAAVNAAADSATW